MNLKNKLQWLYIRHIFIKFLFWFFILLSILSITILSDYQIFNFLPKSLHSYVVTDKKDEFIFNLSIGYIVSAIFYLIVVYLPDLKKKKSAYIITSVDLEYIVREMYIDINYLNFQLGLNGFQKKISLSSFSRLRKRKLLNKPTDFYYQWQNTKYSTGQITEINHFSHNANLIIRNINRIFSNPLSIYLDSNLLLALSLLKDNWFIKSTSEQLNNPMYLDKGYYEYNLLFIEITKYVKKPIITFKYN